MFGRQHKKPVKFSPEERPDESSAAPPLENLPGTERLDTFSPIDIVDTVSHAAHSDRAVMVDPAESLPSRKEKHSKQKNVRPSPDNRRNESDQNSFAVQAMAEPSIAPQPTMPAESVAEAPFAEIFAEIAQEAIPTPSEGMRDTDMEPVSPEADLPAPAKEPVKEKQPKLSREEKAAAKTQKAETGKASRKLRGNLPIGLAFEGNTLIFSEIQSSKSGFRARKLIVRELPDISFPIAEGQMDAFTEILRDIVKAAGWKKRKAVVSAPAEYVMLRHTAIPKMSKKVMDVAIHAEVGNNLSFPFENPYFDYVVLEDSCIAEPEEDNLSVIVVAAPKDDLLRYAACVRNAGLVPIRMEPAILGIRRIVVASAGLADKKLMYAVLDLRFDGAELGIFEGENLLFMRHIEQKPADYPRQNFNFFAAADPEAAADPGPQPPLAAKLPGEIEDFDESSYAADLGYEIDRSLNFVHYNLVKNGSSVGLIYLVSAIVDVDRIVQTLSGRLEQEIRVVESQLLFERPSHDAGTGETPWTVGSARYAAGALGLSLPEV